MCLWCPHSFQPQGTCSPGCPASGAARRLQEAGNSTMSPRGVGGSSQSVQRSLAHHPASRTAPAKGDKARRHDARDSVIRRFSLGGRDTPITQSKFAKSFFQIVWKNHIDMVLFGYIPANSTAVSRSAPRILHILYNRLSEFNQLPVDHIYSLALW